MSQAPSTSKKAQRAICFRVDEDQHKLIAAAANRKNTTPSDYCRELAIAHICRPHEEETISGVYRVALATLEDLLATKSIMFRAMMALLTEQRYAISDLNLEDKQKLVAQLPDSDPMRERDVTDFRRQDIVAMQLAIAETTKEASAQQRLVRQRRRMSDAQGQ